MTPTPRARRVTLPCRACDTPIPVWVYTGTPIAICWPCARQGQRARFGLCARCDHGPAHPWVEFCARCWTEMPPFAQWLYREKGLAAALDHMQARDAAAVRRSGYHR